MTETLAAIKAFAAEQKSRAKPKPQFVPPTTGDFMEGNWLAFDQSLGNTGWALVKTTRHLVRVVDCGMYRSPEGRTPGPQGTLEAVKPMIKEFGRILGFYQADTILYELPAVAGKRTESSLVAAACLQAAHMHHAVTTPLVVMPRQRAANKLVGNKDATKKETSALVDELVGIWRPPKPWNEHVRDAVLLALAYARKESR